MAFRVSSTSTTFVLGFMFGMIFWHFLGGGNTSRAWLQEQYNRRQLVIQGQVEEMREKLAKQRSELEERISLQKEEDQRLMGIREEQLRERQEMERNGRKMKRLEEQVESLQEQANKGLVPGCNRPKSERFRNTYLPRSEELFRRDS